MSPRGKVKWVWGWKVKRGRDEVIPVDSDRGLTQEVMRTDREVKGRLK